MHPETGTLLFFVAKKNEVLLCVEFALEIENLLNAKRFQKKIG